MVLAVAVAAAAGTTSGCSQADQVSNGLTKARYLIEMRALANKVREQTRLAIELVNVGSLKQAVPVIDRAVTAFDEVVARLEEIEPPQEIAALHNRLTAALAGASNLLSDAQAAVKKGDLVSLIVLAPQLNQFRDRFRGIAADYAAAGYELESPAPASP